MRDLFRISAFESDFLFFSTSVRKGLQNVTLVLLWILRDPSCAMQPEHSSSRQVCEFCESGPATKHCPDDVCGFMCDDCDRYRHESGGSKTARYATHKRAKVSSLTIAEAAFRIKGFFRFVFHRGKMREEVRRQYSRFFDGRSKSHFYLFHRTGEVSWNKPLLLGTEELRPFLTVDQAAFKIQQLHRNWRARERARDAMRVAWNRVYSPQERRFFFFYKGKSPLILPTTARWVQPCRSIGGIWVWRPVLSDHVAAMRIQNMWRNFMGRRGLRELTRQVFAMEHNPITGAERYRDLRTGELCDRKPRSLGSERWDQEDMMLWTVEEVVIFIRRCGLKRLAPKLRHFNVDGALLMTFDPEDFLLLGQADSVNAKKILLNIERRPAFNGYNKRPKDLLRRAALRQRYYEETQAEVIQRWWRVMWRKMLRRNWQVTQRIATARDEREKKRKESEIWWMERVRDFSGLDASSAKLFGRRSNILGVRGWGRWNPRGDKWTAAPQEVGAPNRCRLMYRDSQDSRAAVPVNTAEEMQLRDDQARRRAIRKGAVVSD